MLTDDGEAIENLQTYVEKKIGDTADPGEAENRGRVLRRILQKAVSLHRQLPVQQAKYFVNWISAGSPFSAETMQIRGEEVAESRPRVVQYCLEPLVEKAVYCREAYTGTVVIVPAIVVCKP